MSKSSANIYHKSGILQILPSLVSGGVERGTVEIAAAITNNGFNSYVASSGGPMLSQLYNAGAKHFNSSFDSKNPWKIYKNYLTIKNLIIEHDIKIIHARSRAPAWSSYLASRDTGCKFVTTFHGVYKYNNWLKHYYNSIMTKGHKVIAVSHFIDDHIKKNYKMNEENLSVIHRGVDVNYFDPNNIAQQRIVQLVNKLHISTEKPIILFPGRITRWKGHLFLMKALEKLPRDSFICLIAGSDHNHGKYRQELERYIKTSCLANEVSIINHVSDMPALYMLSDVVVSVSTEPEAFGRVVTEAQAMKRLLISTNIGGATETVIPDQTGWLVTPNDAEELAARLAEALSLPLEQKQIIGTKARQHVKDNFSMSAMCDRTINLYKELLES